MPDGNGTGAALTDLDELLPAIAVRDEGAFARWLAGAEAPVRDSLRRFARSVDTEAVLQEALLRAWQLAPRLRSDGRPNALLRFTVVTARNLAISETRRRRHEVPAGEESDAVVDPAPLPDPILKRAIARCYAALSGQPKAALALRLVSRGTQSDRALADAAGMKLNTFLQNVTRARRLLAACLEHAGVALP